jgi:ankyrin repeat protein
MNRRIEQKLFEEAVAENNEPEVRRLLSVGADVNTKDSISDTTPLHVACSRDHSQVVQALLEHGADIEAKTVFDKTPLIVASVMGSSKAVKQLLENGADIEAKDNEWCAPLHWACRSNHLAVVVELLENGADIEAKGSDGKTPLHWACLNYHVAVVIELLGHGAGIDADNDSKGATSILGKRKSRGADTEGKDHHGDTSLHLAIELPVVKVLLSGGANILAANNVGLLPIHQAVLSGNPEVANYLLQQLYATTRRLPLHELVEDLTWIGNPYTHSAPPIRWALREQVLGTDDVVEILEYLVEQNPELISSRDQDGSLPLHVACRRGASFTIVQSLVNHYKASVKSRTSQGDLPLFLACEMSEPSLDTIFILIKLYPDVIYR